MLTRLSCVSRPLLCSLSALSLAPALSGAQESFINFETPHVHPLELAPGDVLLAVNTPDGVLETFDVSSGTAISTGAIPVGIDPVSVRARNANEAWVVNHVSDSISIVDLSAGSVVATIQTEDEPADVIFAGAPQRAYVSCSQANLIMVFDPGSLGSPLNVISINGEDPRALAVSADGSKVYVGIFESGNASTILGGGGDFSGTLAYPPNVVTDSAGPYSGLNPPPNSGSSFSPALNGANPVAPEVGLIVKKDPAGDWMDDNGGNWSQLVSGAQAGASGRLPGWDLPDRDLAIIDTATLGVTYATGLMNIVMAIDVNPATGDVSAVGTDGINQVRFEPNLKGVFGRVHLGIASDTGSSLAVLDMNDHLDYSTPSAPQAERNKAIGDPRGIRWNSLGNRAYVSGMGSNNVITINGSGVRETSGATIEVGEGPTGLALDESMNRLYVLNKFASSISVISTTSDSEIDRVEFHDASPQAIKIGRKHLYSTHDNSGLGQVACATCHVDSRMDRLGWDLGDPSGLMEAFEGNCTDNGCQDWHPMKGPMLTQTLQDIIGKEPHHWRGDQTGIEAFSPAFVGLQADDAEPDSVDMQEFEDFLATIHFPPNPFRNHDNSLPSALNLEGHFTTGRFSPPGQPLGVGDANRGLQLYTPPETLDGPLACVTCHTLPTGLGPNYKLNGLTYSEIPPGPDGELHHSMVSLDGSTQRTIKVPQMRNLYERTGFNATQLSNNAGFGMLHDGSVDSIERFVSEPAFSVASDQDVADLVAFMLSFSGSDLPQGSASNFLFPPGTASLDAHAAVGAQFTFSNGANLSAEEAQYLGDALAMADSSAVALVVKGLQGGLARGHVYVGSGTFQSDRATESTDTMTLLGGSGPGSELTMTIVVVGTEFRLGIDRDEDGFFDRDELDAGSDPADPLSTPIGPGLPFCFGDGLGTPCPCGNDSTTSDGGCLNSSGLGAQLVGAGIADVAGDTLTLTGTNMIPGQASLLFQGNSQVNSGIGVTFGDGLRCAGGSVKRLALLIPDLEGSASYPGPSDLELSVRGGVLSGDTSFYQLWYRDTIGGPCGQGFNLSNAYEVSWQ